MTKLQEEHKTLLEKKEAGTITDSEQARLGEVTGIIIDDEELAEEQKQAAEKALAEKQLKKAEKKGYEVPEGEEDFVHVSQWKGDLFDPKTGKEVASKTIQKYDAKEFANFAKYSTSLGYSYEVLYTPAKK